MLFEQVHVQLQILNAAFAEISVMEADSFRHFVLVLSSQRQHTVIDIDPHDVAIGPHNLRSDVANFASARAQVQYVIAGLQKPRRISAALIPFDDFIGDCLQVFRVI